MREPGTDMQGTLLAAGSDFAVNGERPLLLLRGRQRYFHSSGEVLMLLLKGWRHVCCAAGAAAAAAAQGLKLVLSRMLKLPLRGANMTRAIEGPNVAKAAESCCEMMIMEGLPLEDDAAPQGEGIGTGEATVQVASSCVEAHVG